MCNSCIYIKKKKPSDELQGAEFWGNLKINLSPGTHISRVLNVVTENLRQS